MPEAPKPFVFKHLQPLAKTHFLNDGGTVLIHGVYTSGKTHFLGSALKTEAENGHVLFANIIGEDGQGSAASLMDLDEAQKKDVQTYDAAEELAEYAAHMNTHLLCIDSLPLLYDLVIRKLTKGLRPPLMSKEINEWTTIHLLMENLVTKLRRCAKYVIFSSPSQLGLDLVKDNETIIKGKQMITPDMPGKYATACAKWFDLAMYLKADLKNGVMSRELHVAKSDKWLTRQRLPHEIVEPIVIPQNEGGWTALMTALRANTVS